MPEDLSEASRNVCLHTACKTAQEGVEQYLEAARMWAQHGPPPDVQNPTVADALRHLQALMVSVGKTIHLIQGGTP